MPLLCKSCPVIPLPMKEVVEAAVWTGILYFVPPAILFEILEDSAFPTMVFVTVRLPIVAVLILLVVTVSLVTTAVFVVRFVTLAVEIVLFVAVSFVIVAVFAVKLSIADVPETVSFVIVAFVIVAVGVVKLVMFAAISFPSVTLLIVPPAIDAFSMFALFIFA